MPSWLVAYFKPATAAIMAEVTEHSQNALRTNSQRDLEKSKQAMVQALSSPALPADERRLSRLQEEGMILLSGGTESPANALSVAAFYLVDEISILEKLRTELQPVMCNHETFVPLAELEKLPYLVGHHIHCPFVRTI